MRSWFAAIWFQTSGSRADWCSVFWGRTSQKDLHQQKIKETRKEKIHQNNGKIGTRHLFQSTLSLSGVRP